MRGEGAARGLRAVDWWRLAPTLAALVLAAVYLAWQPRTYDLPTHEFRAQLFGQEGFTVWNGLWYSGHHALAYSVVAPPIGWLLTPAVAVAMATVGSATLFGRIARLHFEARHARWGALWFALAISTLAFTNRLPFALAVMLALGSVLAFLLNRSRLGLCLGAVTGLASPVAALFLAMGAAAWLLAGGPRRRAVALATVALLPPLLVSLIFWEGGYAPFPPNVYAPVLVACVACLLVLPRRQRTLRWATALYMVGSTAAFLITTPLGPNAERLGEVFAGPVLLCAAHQRGFSRAQWYSVAVVLAGLATWQLWGPVKDLYFSVHNPATRSSYYEPLRRELATLPANGRLEIPFTSSHWESAEIAPIYPLARGWQRQLDARYNRIFYDGWLGPRTYARWLMDNGVRYVALPQATLDFHGKEEGRLIESGLPYLDPKWRSSDWTLYEVTLPTEMVTPDSPASISLVAMASDELHLRVKRPGSALLRVHWSPYWLAEGGCVEREGEWTRVIAEREGHIRLVTRFSPERVFQRGRRCNGV